jgi:adenylate cyclase
MGRVWWLRFLRTWKVVLFVAAVAAGAGATVHAFDLFGIGGAELGAYDSGLVAMTGLAGGDEKSKDVVILAIDDLTLQAVAANATYAMNFGAWPYSRNVWARVLEHLASDGARAVVFDAVIDERHSDPSGDLAMGEIARTSSVPLFVGFNVSASKSATPLPKVEPMNRFAAARTSGPKQEEPEEPEGGEEFPSDEFPEGAEGAEAPDDGYPEVSADEVAGALAFPVSVSGIEPTSLSDADGNPRHPQAPIAPLVPAVAGFGLVLMEEDADGKLRRTRFAYTDGTNRYVTLPVAVAADLTKAESVEVTPGLLRIGSRTIPINRDGTAEIDYRGTLDERFQTVSLIHVLDDWAFASLSAKDPEKAAKLARKLAPGFFRGKVVVIGGFALGTADVKGTPFSAATPGVVKQAAEIQNLIDGRFIIEAPFWLSLLITFLIAAFSIGVVVVIRSTLVEVAWPLLLFYGFFLVTGFLLVRYQLHVLSAMPAWAASFSSVIGALYNHLFAPKDRERLRDAFLGAIAKTLLQQLVEERRLPKLSGEVREVTALITDINDFSRLAGRYDDDPAGLQALLSRYHTTLTEVLQRHGGYVNKYIGDTVVCLFGAPLDEPDHAQRACRAAIAILKAAEKLEGSIPELGDGFHTRIGIRSAPMFVGNFGSEQLVDYTAVGDEMRMASRIERENETLGTRVLISQRTVDLCGSSIEVRPSAAVELLEGAPPETIYELVDAR